MNKITKPAESDRTIRKEKRLAKLNSELDTCKKGILDELSILECQDVTVLEPAQTTPEPLPAAKGPKDWRKLHRLLPSGDAKDFWRVENPLSDPCRCKDDDELDCGESCETRCMQYECTEKLCSFTPAKCGNRPFAELARRRKEKDLGIELIQTVDRGYGVRAQRAFEPKEIVLEYTGELITEEENVKRYKDKHCAYSMDLVGGLVIDATERGGEARFLNHSCEPNCEILKIVVHEKPRIGVSVGKNGVSAGEELTIDYNLDAYNGPSQQCHCGTPSCRGWLVKKTNRAESEKPANIKEKTKDAKRKADADVVDQRPAKKIAGWVSLNDPEVLANLVKEKAEKRTAEQQSNRAKRLEERRKRMEAANMGTKPPEEKAEVAKQPGIPIQEIPKQVESEAAFGMEIPHGTSEPAKTSQNDKPRNKRQTPQGKQPPSRQKRQQNRKQMQQAKSLQGQPQNNSNRPQNNRLTPQSRQPQNKPKRQQNEE
ncbi:SET domain-containing protein [Piedraia hortae CBS 480.64]|uniref:SET domain-containing protein n=1 Tax=Piedraia hortae CBS 480.64 TaxID=1314780 RepID=A0A6A7BX38_9PEZI|nr:SET domain-containing protein [Piedraia hortae CBS 480.64]